MDGSPAIDWDFVRDDQFPVARNWAYFDHAAVAPLPRRPERSSANGPSHRSRTASSAGRSSERRLEAIRDRVASLINADRDEIAFINSTTQGIGLIAEGYPWRDGDNVVTAADEYPSNLLPWMNLASRGVDVRQVPSREGRIWLEDLVAAIDRSTRVLAISHVEFATGFRNDLDALAELCQARGVALFVDAIQGLGPHRIDVRQTPIDFLAADGHKWLLGPEGAGFLFVQPRLDRPAPADRRRLAQRRRLVQRPGGRAPAQAERPALGGRLVQHARPADIRGQRGPVPRMGARCRLAADRRSGRGRPRAGRLGRLDGLRLVRAKRTARPSSSWSETASIRPPRRPSCAGPRGRRGLPRGAGCGSARTSTITRKTSNGSGPDSRLR